MVYGSNFGGSDAVRHDLTDGLKLSDEDLQKIRWKNACALLHLDPAKLGSAQDAGRGGSDGVKLARCSDGSATVLGVVDLSAEVVRPIEGAVRGMGTVGHAGRG